MDVGDIVFTGEVEFENTEPNSVIVITPEGDTSSLPVQEVP